MNIGIDTSISDIKKRGMSRFVIELIKNIPIEIKSISPKNIRLSRFKILSFFFKFFPFWEQFILPFICKKNKFEYLICPYNTGPIYKMNKTKLIIVIHDLIYIDEIEKNFFNLSLMELIVCFYRFLILRKAIKNAKIIISVSNHSLKLIENRFDIKDKKKLVIPNTINKIFYNKIVELEYRKPYLVTVTGHKDSKNLKNLILAFSKIAEKLYPLPYLYVVGLNKKYHPKFKKIAKLLSIQDQIIFLEFIDDKKLFELYSYSKGFVFPSKSEGFGIPIIEAMSTGTPVACSNTSCMPEIGADCVTYFDPNSIHDISIGIQKIWEQNVKVKNKVLKAIKRAREYYPYLYEKSIEELTNLIKAK